MEEKKLKIMKKQLWTTRLLLLVMCAILAVLTWFGVILVPPVLTTLNEIQEAASEVEEVAKGLNDEVIPALARFDSEALNEAIFNFDSTVQELDIEALNKAVANLEDSVSNLNVDELNDAIENLNSTIEGLSAIGNFLF